MNQEATTTPGHHAQRDDTTAPEPSTPPTVMQSLEDAIQSGLNYAKENPAITALGVASVAAIVVIASKSANRHPSSIAVVERRIRDAAANSATHAGNAVDTISDSLGRAFTADPRNLELLQATVADWMASARSRVEPIIDSALSRR
ncbi:MAG TPA: hypothetical protein PK970_07985 [Hyphomicrobiaceae bacterium]|nr:hypothetical protein [Hyphomicrobiaceae bacterium]